MSLARPVCCIKQTLCFFRKSGACALKLVKPSGSRKRLNARKRSRSAQHFVRGV